MKRILLFLAIGGTLPSASLVSSSCGSIVSKGPDTLIINTTNPGLEDSGQSQKNAPKPIVEAKVKQGKVKGAVEGGLGTFKAIPFAEAPVGELRWKAPVPKKKFWSPPFLFSAPNISILDGLEPEFQFLPAIIMAIYYLRYICQLVNALLFYDLSRCISESHWSTEYVFI